MPQQVKITYIRSAIGRKEQHKRIVRSLGLRKLHQSRIFDYTDSIKGMIDKVGYLLKVEPVEDIVEPKEQLTGRIFIDKEQRAETKEEAETKPEEVSERVELVEEEMIEEIASAPEEKLEKSEERATATAEEENKDSDVKVEAKDERKPEDVESQPEDEPKPEQNVEQKEAGEEKEPPSEADPTEAEKDKDA